eukprot:3301894-Prymnesium_polylepis.1
MLRGQSNSSGAMPGRGHTAAAPSSKRSQGGLSAADAAREAALKRHAASGLRARGRVTAHVCVRVSSIRLLELVRDVCVLGCGCCGAVPRSVKLSVGRHIEPRPRGPCEAHAFAGWVKTHL